jgi:hypothetical protein
MRGFPILAFVMLVTAGCVEGSADEDKLPTAPTTASVSAETGGIEGKILTDELQPIRRAQVALLPASGNTTSAEDGSYAFSDLAPGKYTVIATALGFYQRTRAVEVAVGEIAQGDLILDQVPASMPPYDEITKFQGSLVASDACEAGSFHPETKDVSWRDHEIIINATKDEIPIAAVLLDIDLKSIDSPATVDVDLHFINEAGKEIAAGTSADPNEHVEYEKYIPAGKYFVRVWLCAGAKTDYTADVKITYEQGDIAKAIQEGKKK